MLPRECRCAHLRQTSPAWRVAVVETTAPPSEMLRQAGHRLFWHTNWQFPVPTNYSLIRQRKFPDTKRTGNLPQALQIVMRFCVRHRQNDPKQIEFVKIPCYFPCCQGIHELLGDARTPQPGSRRAKGVTFLTNRRWRWLDRRQGHAAEKTLPSPKTGRVNITPAHRISPACTRWNPSAPGTKRR